MFSDKRVVCDGCANEFNEEDVYIVNDEFSDKRIECQDCHNFQMESREEIMCDSCGEYFDMVHIELRIGDEAFCPYCGESLEDYDL